MFPLAVDYAIKNNLYGITKDNYNTYGVYKYTLNDSSFSVKIDIGTIGSGSYEGQTINLEYQDLVQFVLKAFRYRFYYLDTLDLFFNTGSLSLLTKDFEDANEARDCSYNYNKQMTQFTMDCSDKNEYCLTGAKLGKYFKLWIGFCEIDTVYFLNLKDYYFDNESYSYPNLPKPLEVFLVNTDIFTYT